MEQQAIRQHRTEQPAGKAEAKQEAPNQAKQSPVPKPDEPWAETVSQDLVGLALSGGGIRSATFNLGLLQALHEAGHLSKIDYLSTVSGGGYVGSFWTRWRKSKSTEEEIFPSTKTPGAPNDRGYFAIRHLREFSRFLIPRVDLFETELWAALAKVVGGLLFSLIFGLAVMAAVILAWAALAQWMLYPEVVGSGAPNLLTSSVLFAILLTTTFIWSEYLAVSRHKFEADPKRGAVEFNTRAALATLIAVAGWFALQNGTLPGPGGSLLPDRAGYNFAWHNFTPAIYLFILFLGVMLWRLLPTPTGSLAVNAAYDRIKARFLFLAVFWAGLAGLWELGSWLRSVNLGTELPPTSKLPYIGGTSAGLAFLYAAMRKWIVGTQEDSLRGGFKNGLKNLVPNVIASAAVLLLAITITMAFMDLAEFLRVRQMSWTIVVIPWLVVGLILLLIDPVALSLHEFYRSRLARCYLGAANPDAKTAAENRQTFERRSDDMALAEDQELPIHLVCCAANTVGEDRLSTLYRGARSAVLSRFGVAIGDAFREEKGLQLSSALTASGAAFNSNMGRKSILYGRASCFLMTMLNVRLGLWIRHPQVECQKGHWFDTSLIRELFGWTRCEIVADERLPSLNRSMVHLSDGGHFENLGLYELVRRHCRFIIVSDAAADPNYSFGDLANAVRRIREDFGVEIEIDTNPLRPQADGFSPQHMVVGTIHYDGPSGIDKGVILFFKPVLTGEEPTDVLEYKRSNLVFPQQSTGDQFYSEAQWESYRRLGEHAMHAHLKQSSTGKSNLASQRIFRSLRLAAEDVPWADNETYRTVSRTCSELESFFRDTAPPALCRELFPEMATQPCAGPLTTDTFFTLLRVLQTLEEVAEACDLYTYWSHPLAGGWMNYLRRWTNLPSLKVLWPILKPLYASGFAQFLEARCGLQSFAELKSICELKEYPEKSGEGWKEGLAAKQWLAEAPARLKPDNRIFGLEIKIPQLGEPIQVGLVRVDMEKQPRGGWARWRWDDLYVANALRGGGYTSLLLDWLLEKLVAIGCSGAEVEFGRHELRDAGHRRRIVELVDFYRSREFEWSSATTMQKRLSPSQKVQGA